ncbi:MAG: response regulator [Candidatus Eiseniibacteriota bacterium]|nr:MAG: response regulator [Candidatus Eisenbacteria bacterium]
MAQRILVVEDDTNIRNVLRLQLEDAGYEITAVEDGIKALEQVERETPDLILLDIMMPKMDGYEVCRRLRRDFHTSRVPIIMLTAKTTLGEKVEGFEHGANDYLTKPYRLEELLARVKSALQWSRAQRESNPLTGLPGNTSIEAETNRRIESRAPFAYCHCDPDTFKAFNDYYGYSRGDEAIKLTAGIILNAVEAHGTGEDFVGHIGGDDFVYITVPGYAEIIGERICAEFEQKVRFLYAETDRRRGYIEIENRQRVLERYDFMHITVVVVSSERYNLTHFAQVIDIAADLKRYGKTLPGSVVVCERRTAQHRAMGSRTGS